MTQPSEDLLTSSSSDEAQHKPSMIEALEKLAADAPEEGITLKELTTALGDQAFGTALFILALPCCIPFLYVVPQIVAVPMALLAFQMVLGRKQPWIPSKYAGRKIKREGLEQTAKGGRKYFGWVEKLSRPRLTFLTSSKLDRLIGLILVVFCLSILTPIPGTNTVPGFAVAMVSFGIMERDGLLTTGGLLLGSTWIAILLAGGTAVIKTLIGLA
ncbi:exopolysaccharide biosynthesis protein [Hirschia litorea]|uniref:Exopolysaccharide biosynthesis protein n=1 Tax=Hirschia litorea TaxID=1199156 RepID=A0ABW2ILY2_9PROT